MSDSSILVGKNIFVATVTRCLPCNGWEFEAIVFASEKHAEKWIYRQIDTLVKKYSLNRDRDVEDWYVNIDANSSVQFDIRHQNIY